MMMTNTMLWTAAHHQIPILAIVHNNRSYHMEVMHTLRMADRRSRGTARIPIGTHITHPKNDFAGLAKSKGVYGQSPLHKSHQLRPRDKTALRGGQRGEA